MEEFPSQPLPGPDKMLLRKFALTTFVTFALVLTGCSKPADETAPPVVQTAEVLRQAAVAMQVIYDDGEPVRAASDPRHRGESRVIE